jgi:hypothetical protein
MSDKNKIIIGLADQSVGAKVGNIVSNVSGTALTVGTAGSVGFFAQATSAAVTDFASLKLPSNPTAWLAVDTGEGLWLGNWSEALFIDGISNPKPGVHPTAH